MIVPRATTTHRRTPGPPMTAALPATTVPLKRILTQTALVVATTTTTIARAPVLVAPPGRAAYGRHAGGRNATAMALAAMMAVGAMAVTAVAAIAIEPPHATVARIATVREGTAPLNAIAAPIETVRVRAEKNPNGASTNPAAPLRAMEKAALAAAAAGGGASPVLGPGWVDRVATPQRKLLSASPIPPPAAGRCPE